MISYAIITAINAYIEKRDLDYYIRSQTFHNVDYEGEVTLSDKLSADDFDDDLMTHAFFGSEVGVYAPIQVETDRHLYQGQIVLAPRGIRKTSGFSYTDLDVEFKSLTLDYSLQTRGYAAYSDYSDPRMKSLFFGSSVINPLFDENLPLELYNIFYTGLYMKNSIMYLEDEISRLTIENHEEHYDTIMPYMMYGIGTLRPSLKFASSEGNIPLPEFYEEYPIFVPEEYYDEVKDEHHLIYKIFDGSTYEIQVVPDYSVHELCSDIESIDVFLVGIQDDECEKCELKGTLYDDGYSFNSTSGVLTIDEERFATFKTLLDSEIESADYEPYLCLKLYVEKFRSMSDNRTLTSEEVGEIATIQSAQARMLEYLYQFTIAEETQARLEEIEHTMFVTMWSTAILLGISAVNSFVSSAVSGGLAAGVASLGKEALKALYRIPSEIFQELYIDPYIELYVSKTVEKMGGSFWEQVLWSSLAEGARETLTGSVFSAFKSSMQRASVNDIQSHKALSKIMDRSSIESDIRLEVDEMKAQLESTSLKETGGV